MNAVHVADALLQFDVVEPGGKFRRFRACRPPCVVVMQRMLYTAVHCITYTASVCGSFVWCCHLPYDGVMGACPTAPDAIWQMDS
jgi:hypothetical protein